MSNHPFSLSVIAAAVLYVCHSTNAVAETVTESIDNLNNQLDLQQLSISQFHYRQSDIALGLTGATVLPTGPHQDVTITHAGATDGVAILQDGIFFSPAPYSGQHLVLQPNLLHQQKVSFSSMTSVTESSQAAFGKLDYQSVQISPQKYATDINVEGSDNNAINGGVVLSGTSKQNGMLLAVDYQSAADDVGYRVARDADTTQKDILFKIAADSLPGARNEQMTEFSYQYSSQEADRGTLGLTSVDFSVNPTQLYSAASTDNTEGERQRYVLAHKLIMSSTSTMATDFYYQTYSQQSQAMQFVDGEQINSALLSRIAMFEATPTADGINLGSLTQNNDFAGFGMQTKGVSMYGQHQVTYSARYHTDKAEMRLGQRDWSWNNDLSLTPTTDDEYALTYTDDASAFSSAVDTKLNYGQWSINLGLGYEHVSVSRELGDVNTSLNAADFSDDGWSPSIEVAYQSGPWLAALQAKQAWTAASAGNIEQTAQEALQYQLALSYQQDALSIAMTAYMHDYDNQHVSCMQGMICDYEQISLQENIKDVSVVGADLSIAYGLTFDHFSIPFKAKYQYTQAETDSANCNELMACFAANSQLPWVSEQQLALSSGVVYGDMSVMAQALYQSELGYQGGFTNERAIDSQWKVDIAATYRLTEQHELYLRVENLLDEELVANSTAMGFQAQSEMTTYFGYQGHF
ncbi:TonB-dependent receptor [Shewanella sp. BF02_Schw]|uniref:TonB-dependent receptor domain-containing protein n=1 Tax=Shewanella sp. BF02_Schw TaxID=394908 RepID=UPI001787601C|nr:TonB-dependent receptor [Shewanella sp. BF02_Schw]MBO1895920.1 TonB-dependent receptor [Shewanella sp. BF02_Schw]